MKDFDFVVIGAGASGLLAAIRASENGNSVAVLEKMKKPARKLMITGKGRCNITNSAEIDEFLQHVYPDGRFLYSAFKKFYSYDIIALLDECGVEVMLERGGRYFPSSEKASDIVDALYKKAKSNGVKFYFDTEVKKLNHKDGKITSFVAKDSSGERVVNTKNILLSTGGKSYPATGSTGDGYRIAESLGHKIENPLPALVPLNVKEAYAMEMQGLTLKNINARLYIDGNLETEYFGDLLFTHFGISGPIVLTFSRLVVQALESSKKVKILLDLKPALDNSKLDERLLRDIDANGKKKIANLYKSWLPQKAISILMELAEIDPEKPSSQISGKERGRILNSLKNLELNIASHRGFKEAIVTSGGVSLNEVNQRTMESKLIEGLYFAGEVLDLDADTGGYNLQIAFSTGWLAGDSV